jgi:wyosine [tRNA(Phe)-imidazoG37] synthetase (radical SAM superfamily)
MRLEVMLVRDLNDTAASIANLASHIAQLGPITVDPSTPVRPGASTEGQPCTEEFLARVAQQFGSNATPIAAFPEKTAGRISEQKQSLKRFVLKTLSRRPCTTGDLVATTGVPANELVKLLDSLIAAGAVEERPGKGEVYFWAPP